MDLTTIIGIVVGLALIIFGGIGADKIPNFIDSNSMFIVFGGTLAAVVASFPWSTLKQTVKHFKVMVQGKRYDTEKLIDTLVDMAQVARKSGLLALEERAGELDDPFFKQGIMMIVDAAEPEEVRTLLENELATTAERHDEMISVYEKASAFAPGFGMIGTLVGLVNMLMNMDPSEGGSSTIGTDMGVALITTFYGCVLAQLVFSPMAKKLSIRNNEEVVYKQIMIEGILAMQAGDNPKFLKEKLVTYLSTKERLKLLDEESGGTKTKKDKKKKK
ncbi:MAG: motility protein A [Lachnospiraceae bacterium]|nr:motility protein A [Lachnospiraceae bacterium]